MIITLRDALALIYLHSLMFFRYLIVTVVVSCYGTLQTGPAHIISRDTSQIFQEYVRKTYALSSEYGTNV